MHFLQTQGRESIAAKLVANLITEAGANRVLACDLHSGQSMGYFDIPVDHVYGQVRFFPTEIIDSGAVLCHYQEAESQESNEAAVWPRTAFTS